jgi:hypothetical protein
MSKIAHSVLMLAAALHLPVHAQEAMLQLTEVRALPLADSGAVTGVAATPSGVAIVSYAGQPGVSLLRDGHARVQVQSARVRAPSGESLLAVAPDGNSFFVVDRPVPSTRGTASFRVTKIRPRGDTTYSRLFRAPAVAVTPASADSLVDAEVRRQAPTLRGTGLPIRTAIREALALPRFQPTVTAAVAGRDGTVWLRREALGRDTVEWTVLNPAGHLQARVELPTRVRIYEAELGRIWGVELDDLDVPWIVRYTVTAPAGRRASRL